MRFCQDFTVQINSLVTIFSASVKGNELNKIKKKKLVTTLAFAC